MTDTPTEPTLDADRLRELLAKATPGPWRVKKYDPRTVAQTVGVIVGFEGPSGSVLTDADAALIVAAVNALPTLFDRLDRLTKASRLVVRAAHDSTMVTDEWVKQTLEPALDDPEGA